MRGVRIDREEGQEGQECVVNEDEAKQIILNTFNDVVQHANFCMAMNRAFEQYCKDNGLKVNFATLNHYLEEENYKHPQDAKDQKK